MKEKDDDKLLPVNKTQGKPNTDLPGYPSYPESDDIFNKFQEEKDINPEDILKTKALNPEPGLSNRNDFNKDETGNDLDIPGAELDDEMENIGSEDEENNYYSLGGDDHNDLDENKNW